MIIKWLLDAFTIVLGGILSGLEALVPDPPGWVSSGMAQLANVYDKAGLFDTWIPVALALTLVGWILAAHAIAAIMRLTRVAASYATLGGGAVAD
ncbi:hypothetical protein EFK50_01395 [Nocardioides marmoriginsengisoli]|uniref:Uncharacterized protein n=1 Tax=Nocardioides marmoriginsengisoli TaxID=661483 RepID=A0A3N0CR22_9ACTN|nr:hypothetical protein [Nocardioides marmoriginsengisoli]RNL65731.1 hypothetical protein EFK50_01395 [Nocardioides marmoriginsengisoli]